MGDPTGEPDKGALRPDFDRRVLLQFRGSTITSAGGLLAYRELDDALGLTDTGADARTGKNGRHRLAGLLRQSVFGRLAGYEDVNDAERFVPRPGDALGGRRQSAHGSGCLGQPDGPLRDRMAGGAGKPRRSCRSAGPMDRRGAQAASAAGRRARYGFERKPDLRRTGRQRLQRALRLHLLPSAVRVQPAWRSRAVRPALGQRAQRRQLARSTGAGSRPLPWHCEAVLFPRRCGLRQPGDLRVPRSRRHGLCDPATGQSGVARQDRLPPQAPGRAIAAGGAPLLCQLSLPSRLMDKAPTSGGQEPAPAKAGVE